MDLTPYIPLIDTISKIGLGGLLAGLFAIVGTRMASGNKIREELVTKRREELLAITKEFSELHNRFTDQWGTKIASLSPEIPEVEGFDFKEWVESELLEKFPDVYDGLLKLHEIEARLCLIGAPEISHLVEEYRFLATMVADVEDEELDKTSLLAMKHEGLMLARRKILIAMTIFFAEG